MTFQREKLTEVFSEVVSTFHIHWHEISDLSDLDFEPDWLIYAQAEIAEEFVFFTARDDHGRIQGYAAFFLRPMLHSKKYRQAFQDALYIKKEARGFGHKFLKWCDNELAAIGIDSVYHCVTPACDFSPILKRQGYEVTETIYMKRLKRG